MKEDFSKGVKDLRMGLEKVAVEATRDLQRLRGGKETQALGTLSRSVNETDPLFRKEDDEEMDVGDRESADHPGSWTAL